MYEDLNIYQKTRQSIDNSVIEALNSSTESENRFKEKIGLAIQSSNMIVGLVGVTG